MKIDFTKMKAAALRVNAKAPAHVIKFTDDIASKKMRGSYVPVQRKEGEALPPEQNSLWERGIYRTGDGDTPLVIRPGSLDFKKWPSKGL
jgi:hypothetical protein